MKLDDIIKTKLNKMVNENNMEENYMFFSNLKQIHRQCELLLKMDKNTLDSIIQNGHDWADDHVSEAKTNMDQVFDFFMNETKENINEDKKIVCGSCGWSWDYSDGGNDPYVCHKCGHNNENMNESTKKTIIISEAQFDRLFKYNEETPVMVYEDEFGSVQMTNYVVDNLINEAEYQGRKVKLGKIMQGDIKKFKVYVKNDKGKVVKVNFGFGGKSAKGKRMVIKKNNPARRKSFRARMNCDNPGPRWKPRYWACKTW
jgi:DNA-directed RNA polymerase subunit RPC12/RpoP